MLTPFHAASGSASGIRRLQVPRALGGDRAAQSPIHFSGMSIVGFLATTVAFSRSE